MEKLKLLKFFSPCCGPCKALSKNLENWNRLPIEEIDISDESGFATAQSYQIRATPAIVLIDENDVNKTALITWTGITTTEIIDKYLDKREKDIELLEQ